MIRYTTDARRDVGRLHRWLKLRSHNAASRLLDALKDAEDAIDATPSAWPLVRPKVRRYVLRFGRSAYVFEYAEDGGDQIILRIWHGRERRSP